MKLYNGKLYHEYDDPETELAALQEKQKPVWSVNLDGIEPVSYKIGNVKEGSLASSNPIEGVKLAKEEYTVDEYMDYIFSRGKYEGNETAEQKREVFRQIQDDEQIEGDLETFLRSLIQTPDDVKFILLHHEASHLRNNDIANYFEGDVKGLPINWMHPRKIAIEKRATMDALHRLIRYKENNVDQGGIEQISLGRTYRIVRDDGSVETKLINTPIDYYELKS
jgi:Fic family protein